MRIRDAMVGNGRFLFRWRSLLPLALAPAFLLSLMETSQIDQLLGESLDSLWQYACLIVSLGGLALRCYTVGCSPRGTSGRGTRRLRADRLNTTGMYSIVRNPLYLGNAVMALGLILAVKVWWFAAIVGLAGYLYLERIIAAEEEFLAERFGDEFTRWVERTPAFLPRLAGWQRPEMPFSWRAVLRREYHGFLVIATGFFCVDAFTDLVVERTPFGEWVRSDYSWPALLAAALVLALTLRTVKKHTRWLHERGR